MIDLAVMLLQDAHFRFRRARQSEDGASVIEWAMIAAIVVVAASVIGVVVMKIVTNKSQQLDDCASKPAGSACSP
jgi:Flp pilus assembly pilin Flp